LQRSPAESSSAGRLRGEIYWSEDGPEDGIEDGPEDGTEAQGRGGGAHPPLVYPNMAARCFI
jgi:hypothetical protein